MDNISDTIRYYFYLINRLDISATLEVTNAYSM